MDLEKFFADNEKPTFEMLKNAYPEAEIYMDPYIYWVTVGVKLTPTKFIVAHDYYDSLYDNFVLLMEGEVKDLGSHKEVVVSKYFEKDGHNGKMKFTFKEMRGTPNSEKNGIHLHEMLLMDPFNLDRNTIYKKVGEEKFTNPVMIIDKILSWK